MPCCMEIASIWAKFSASVLSNMTGATWVRWAQEHHKEMSNSYESKPIDHKTVGFCRCG